MAGRRGGPRADRARRGRRSCPRSTTTRAVAVRHGDELFGALTLDQAAERTAHTHRGQARCRTSRRRPAWSCATSGLTAELQASVDELRASRRRLVEAQDEERRKIERNLHDGAQQQLVALTVQLGLLERLADDPERVRQMATQLQGGLRDALDDLRDLARGIYPPLLADKGLAVALEAQGRKAAVPTTIEPDGVGRYPREVEAAVYFCALEAMQNVAKYADARSADGPTRRARRPPRVRDRGRRPRFRRGCDDVSARGCRGWRIASTRSAARSTSGARRARERWCAARSSSSMTGPRRGPSDLPRER